ncbi:MAG: hypothetical protein UR15_C0025G0006 [Parcubacteria group bacterium GW2011_GWA2_31_28]|nr:MAG: hypothetical protein UR15_C0025G0006 [Parcubacteria group bacterium GW2011_GWA2_31_28]
MFQIVKEVAPNAEETIKYNGKRFGSIPARQTTAGSFNPQDCGV